MSPEYRKRLSIAHMGEKHTDEHRRNSSLAMLGKPSGMLGKKHTYEAKLKMSVSHKGIRAWQWKGGLPNCEVCGKKLSQRHGKSSKCNPCFLEAQFKAKKPTSIEEKVYNELKSMGLLFETQKFINGKFVVDVYVPSLNLVVEADGDYWHGLERIKNKDKAENAYLTKCGFNVLRLSESEINDGSFKERIRVKS
jgi:very-short-patch-repair endonuclease